MSVLKADGTLIGVIQTINSNANFTCVDNLAANITDATTITFRFASPWTEVNNIVTVNSSLTSGNYLKIQMNEDTLWDMHGSYEYTKLDDIINNFLIAYVGPGKLIPSVKRTDVIFHAKRGLQEFSYDTLKSIKSQELTLPNESLSVIIPQDYVNYVSLKWIDNQGVLHPIYPANGLTSDPYESPIQDDDGVPTQDNFGSNITGTSQTEEAWRTANDKLITQNWTNDYWRGYAENYDDPWYFSRWAYGRRYGLNPETSQFNGWFTINERNGTFNFSSDLKDKIIVLEYISDGL